MTVKKIGILVSSLDSLQLSNDLINFVNSILEDKSNLDIIVFKEEAGLLPTIPRFAIMQMHEVWSFDGICISTDVDTSRYLISAPCPKEKYFYVYNLEWLYHSNPVYSELASVYMSPELKLIARSRSHYNILNKVWKQPRGIIEDFNHDQFNDIFKL